METGEQDHRLGRGVVGHLLVLPAGRRGGRVQLGPVAAVPGPGLVGEAGAGGGAATEQQELFGGGVEDHRGPGAGRGAAGGVMERPSGPGAGPGVGEYRARAPAAEQDQFVLGRVVGECRPLPARRRGGGGPGWCGVAVARRTRIGLAGRRDGHRGHGQRGTRPRGVPEQAADAYCEHRRDHWTSSARRGWLPDKRRSRGPAGLLRPYSAAATLG